MDDAKYIILRKTYGTTHKSNRLGPNLGSLGNDVQTGLSPAPFTVNISTLGEREATELRRDPHVLASARSVPIGLIRPIVGPLTLADQTDEMSDARAAGASWGIREVAPTAELRTGSGIAVAVLDTGIDPKHPAFDGVTLTQRNFSESPNEDDLHGHGTHCAGTIFGRDVDGIRIGVARGVRTALIGKVLDDHGNGNSTSLVEAIEWAINRGAKVISMSIGIDFAGLITLLTQQGIPHREATSRALVQYRDTLRLFDTLIQFVSAQDAYSGRGATVIAAAGNESARAGIPPYVVDVSLPAAANGVISVGAIQRSGSGHQIAAFSNRNPTLCAPGVNIVSARVGGGLITLNGTSMAAPHVAGVAVMWWEKVLFDNPRASGDLLRSKLIAHCRTTGFDPEVSHLDRGAGIVSSPG